MTIRIDAQLGTVQEMEVAVSGPNGANRFFIYMGIAHVVHDITGPGTHRDTYAFLVGPVLSHDQFHRAIATVSASGFKVMGVGRPGVVDFLGWVENVDADWDDESGRVEVRFEATAQVGTGSDGTGVGSGVVRIAYVVSILAEVS